MKLGALFAGLEAQVPPASRDLEVRSLCVDSRQVAPGALFAAFRGVRDDGARFVPQAVAAGACAVLSGAEVPCEPAACVVAPAPRRAFALAAARFHGEPSRRLRLLGVTGTNGKTTATYLIEQLASALGYRAGLVGTVEQRWPGHVAPSTHTTPESHELQATLARMAAAGVTVAGLEVSSHALSQERVSGCTFAGAAFTNLSRDHLDYHGTLEDYFDAKARLFRDLLPAGAPAVLNLDDPRCSALAEELAGGGRAVLGFTARGARPPRGAGLLSAERLVSDLEGLRFALRALPPAQQTGAPDPAATELLVDSPLVGAHNAENLMTALGLLWSGAQLPLAALCLAARGARGAPGRLDRIDDPAGRHLLVDYAHSDDALARVLDALLAARPPRATSRLLCVFGCGGDRDKGKRPLMGRAVGARAALAIATSDNPRTEDPRRILAEVEPGLLASGRRRLSPEEARRGADGYLIEPDRRAALRLACSCARSGDVVLVAGKGHERVQIVGSRELPFDDRQEVARALAEQTAEGDAPPRPIGNPAVAGDGRATDRGGER
jgi:UDP-N-acetylmuramoyl-L-alanyl-D-glutamate--2,6-diaminopimelate ligase